MAKESNVDTDIAKICATKGAYHRKNHGNIYQKDVPDHTIVYKGRHISLEAKSPKGRLSDGQRRQLIKIQKAGAIAEVCFDPHLLLAIFTSIDTGLPWENGNY